ncbi:MAG: hypothetical protein BWZ10_02972 [candidate division BRC1 bacterium ADurb.BinA364]|nr:MAG: hypothetical protein BWZ10_02972 [candidate division BRC1 bacterium ADurb.BinA364]
MLRMIALRCVARRAGKLNTWPGTAAPILGHLLYASTWMFSTTHWIGLRIQIGSALFNCQSVQLRNRATPPPFRFESPAMMKQSSTCQPSYGSPSGTSRVMPSVLPCQAPTTATSLTGEIEWLMWLWASAI